MRASVWIASFLGFFLAACSDRVTTAPRSIEVDAGFWERVESHVLKIQQTEWDKTMPYSDEAFFAERPESVVVKNYRELLESAGVPFREDETVMFVPVKDRNGNLLIFGDENYAQEIETILSQFLSVQPKPTRD